MTLQLSAPLSTETFGDPNAVRQRKSWMSILVANAV
jgi:hypothetical protein